MRALFNISMKARRRTAARWIDRRSNDPWTSADEADFQAWRDDDAVNDATYNAVAAVWNDPALSESLRAMDATPVPPIRHRGKAAWWAALAAGGAAIATAVILNLVGDTRYRLAPPMVSYASTPGERHTVTLEDGSIMTLNAGARAAVQFGADRRTVALQRGEAFFQVAADTSRPFVVQTGYGDMQALGTAFNVDVYATGLVLTVAEGSVMATNTARTHRTVVAGEQVDISADTFSAIRPVSPDSAGTWRDGWIETRSMPMSRLAERIERETGEQVLFASPGLADLTVSGRFKNKDTADLLGALGEIHGFVVEQQGSTLVLKSRPPRSH